MSAIRLRRLAALVLILAAVGQVILLPGTD